MNHRQRLRLSGLVPVTLLITHTVAVLWVAIWVTTVENPSEAGMVWLLFLAVDFPISLAIWVLIYVLGGAILPQWISQQSINVIYALLFGILGGGQYFWIGTKIQCCRAKWSRPMPEANIDRSPDIADT